MKIGNIVGTDRHRERQIKKAFHKVKEELSEHLDAINDNTNEIQANYEYLLRLEEKIDKLGEKFEGLRLAISQIAKEKQAESSMALACSKDQTSLENFFKKNDRHLSPAERRVFLALYATIRPIRYSELGKSLGMSEFLVANCITDLIEKGIPIAKSYQRNHVLVELEHGFRLDQEKRKVQKSGKT